MASYLDFLRITRRDGIRRCYWVCGEEVLLREQVVSLVRREVIKAGVSDRSSISVQEDGEAAVWDAMDSWSLDSDRAGFLVVRGAERLVRVEKLAAWLLDRAAPRKVVVFVSDDPSWPTSHKPEARERVTKSGMYVQCSPQSENSAVEIVAGWLEGDRVAAERILKRCGWDLNTTRDAAKKAAILNRRSDPRVLAYLTEPQPTEQFAVQLTACDRRAAVSSAVLLETSAERSAAIGLLDANLSALSKINRALRTAWSPREIAARLDLHRLVVERLQPYARLYGADEVRHRAVELAVADRALAEGAEIGVLEALALKW